MTKEKKKKYKKLPGLKNQEPVKKRKPMPVYVLIDKNKPLMPTFRFGWVTRSLKTSKCKVVSLEPFTIQLLYDAETNVQEISFGVDTGSKHIGVSATTEKKELFSAQVEVRPPKGNNGIQTLLKQRKDARRNRRSRKIRNRKMRKNRKRGSGWLSPTSRALMQYHINIVNKVRRILPISKCYVELCKFDAHKILNPEVEGVGYQHGPLYGSENIKAYVRHRDKYKCQLCHGKSGDVHLDVHHIQHQSKHGPDHLNNLITLCKTCHDKVHRGELTVRKRKERSYNLSDIGIVGSMKTQLMQRLKEILPTYGTTGSWTAFNRKRFHIEKYHVADALCISGNYAARPLKAHYEYRTARRHNRKLHLEVFQKKSHKQRHDDRINKAPIERPYRAAIKSMNGFCRNDIVRYAGREFILDGMRRDGGFKILNRNNLKIANDNIDFKHLSIIHHNNPMFISRIVEN